MVEPGVNYVQVNMMDNAVEVINGVWMWTDTFHDEWWSFSLEASKDGKTWTRVGGSSYKVTNTRPPPQQEAPPEFVAI